MSVMWIGGQRFAAGMLWHRGLVTGRAARRAARESRSSWKADVAGQTGFLDDAEGPEGTIPLAGALMALLRGRSQGSETWIAFVEEDGGDGADRRVGVVRCSAGLLLADGDAVHASAAEAVEAVGAAGAEGILVATTPGLSAVFPDAVRIDGAALLQAAAETEPVSAVASRGTSRKGLAWAAVCLAVVVVGNYAWTNRTAIGIRLGLVEEKKDRPRVSVEVDTGRFLAHCRDALANRETGLAGFERVAVYCHTRYRRGKDIGAPGKLKGRPVLEVRWSLRKPLPARVYGPLAEELLKRWWWAGVNDDGAAVAVSPLPQVLVRSRGVGLPKAPAFRAAIDGRLALRGFRIEYLWEKQVEVVLETERPLAEAVALVGGVEGLEVLSAAFENGRWRFEGRRRRAESMFEDRFMKVTAPLASAPQTTSEENPERRAS